LERSDNPGIQIIEGAINPDRVNGAHA
jgi:hypothetical protein